MWDIVDAQTGTSQFTPDGQPTGAGNKALPLGAQTPEIYINEPVTSIAPIVDLFFDRDLGRLYIALQVTAGVSKQAGARSLVVASLINGALRLQPIAPDAVFTDNTKIIGGSGSLAQSAIFKVRTMQTTSYLRYLIVVGGNEQTTAEKVFALPLVDNLQDPAHGTLADVNSKPVTLFADGLPHRFLARVFAKGAQNPDDVYNMTNRHGIVGADGTLPGPITDISVTGDAVFVSVAQKGNGAQAGIFHSQALFDSEGRIGRWTRWQRVAGIDKPTAGHGYDPFLGQFCALLTHDDQMPVDMPRTVVRTTFDNENDPLTNFIAQHLAPCTGGVQGLIDFPLTTNGFSQENGERLACNVFTGYKKLILMQTGKDEQGFFGPFRKLHPPFISTDGTLAGFNQQPTMVLSGGALDALGPIGSAAVVSDGTQGWFVFGGSGGVAVLADKMGNGWDASTGLKTGFNGLGENFSCVKISGIKNVRKLIAVGNSLYVLTSNTVERLTLDSASIAAGSVITVTLASLTKRQRHDSHSFSDLIITGPMALLATSYGLLRSGNGVNIELVDSKDHVWWTPIVLPESTGSSFMPGPVTRLFALSHTGNETDVAHKGMVIALNASVSMSETQLYRLAIDLKQGEVTDKTVQLLPDLFILGPRTFFAPLGDYRNYVVTDGALIAVSRSAFGLQKPLIELLSPLLKSGQPQGARSRVIFTPLQSQAVAVGKLIRDSASGAWMIPGDFGVRIQR